VVVIDLIMRSAMWSSINHDISKWVIVV